MFGLFRKKTELDKLQELYAKLQKEAFELAHSNRKAGDAKMAEAEAVAKRIEHLMTNS